MNNDTSTDHNNQKAQQLNISPRKQHAPLDSMGLIITHNPETIKPRSCSPFRPQDQPKDSFYLLQQHIQPVQQALPKVDVKSHQFHINDQLMKMNDKQRKQVNLSSNVFEPAQIGDILNRSPERKQIINSSVQWTNVHYGKTNSHVNEKAEFDKDYAKQRKQSELQQQYVEGTKHKSPSKIIENEVNIQSKKQNQLFSDIFGQEFGDKERNYLRPQRSLSPQMKWNTYDSIRNFKDFGDMNIKDSKLKSANTESQKESYKKSHPVTQPFFDCKMSFEKIKGQYAQKYQHPQVENNSQMKFGKEKKIEPSNSNKKYSGMYSWKNNYPHKK